MIYKIDSNNGINGKFTGRFYYKSSRAENSLFTFFAGLMAILLLNKTYAIF